MVNSDPRPSSREVGPAINAITRVGARIRTDINKTESVQIKKVDTGAPRFDVKQQKQFFENVV